MTYFDQQPFEIRCEWGFEGIRQLAPDSDAIIVVDVLSLSTCVAVAVANGATVYPYRWQDASAAAYAEQLGAAVASVDRRLDGGYSLSPASLLRIRAGERLVLPSPNGSTLSLATGEIPTLAGCLRNARAVAETAQRFGRRISIVPAGERWSDGSLRPAIEDLAGAGAIIHYLPGTRSPEAQIAEAAFERWNDNLLKHMLNCSSGRELIGRGFESDVALAAALNASACAPLLRAGAYVRFDGEQPRASRSESYSGV